MEAVWQYVDQKPSDELSGVQSKCFAPVIVPAVFVGEGDFILISCDNAAIADSDPVGVAA